MMKNKYMIKLAFINILKKKKRTQLSLFATILSTAVIFSACILLKNVNDFKNMTTIDISHYHYAIKNVDEVSLSNRYQVTKETNLGLNFTYNEEIYQLNSLEVEDEVLPFILKTGNLPNSSNEILVPESMRLDVGESIDLEFSGQDRKSYQVVGVYESDLLFEEIHEGKAIVYTLNKEGETSVFYVKDEKAYLSSSFDSLVNKFEVTTEDIYTNTNLITIDTIKTYMQDTSLVQVFYVVIVLLCIGMSLISIRNVLIISDQSRKREIGLLKSIGAGPKAVRMLLVTELFVLALTGSIIGLVLGFATAYVILMQFIDYLYLVFDFSMLLSPEIMAFSFILGFLLMFLSGLSAYYKYVHTSVIYDLKENQYNFMPPIQQKLVLATGFGWKMFCIYNRRMKKQTRNILTSFVLLVMTAVLFMSVVFSSLTFRNQNTNKSYDFEIKSVMVGNPQVSYRLYDMVKNEELIVQNFKISRVLNQGFRTNPESYGNWWELDHYTVTSDFRYVEVEDACGDIWSNVYFHSTAFDKTEIEKLKPYLVDGSLDNLREKDVVIVLKEGFQGTELCDNFKIGDFVAYYPWIENNPIFPIYRRNMIQEHGRVIAAIVHLSEQETIQLGYPFSENVRIMAYDYEAIGGYDLQESVTFDLQNTATSVDVQDKIETMLMELGCIDTYQVDNIALKIETNKMSSFIMEVLLYPLFMMLFVVSLMNIHNVLSGNVVLKHNDIAIMRSVGMDKKQLCHILVYEYLEGYMNASFMILLFFVPVIILGQQINLLSAFNFIDNLMGTLIFAICFMAVLLLIPLIVINISKFQKIKALDVLKDNI